MWRGLLPSVCALCGAVQGDVVCGDCAAAVLAEVPRCPRCAMACPPGHQCDACASWDTSGRTRGPAFDAAFTLGNYATPQDGLVLALKFGGALPLAGWLASQLAVGVRATGPLPDLLVPIPLSPARLARRGFNQAWEIARPLARHLGVRVAPALLARVRDTPAQSALELSARRTNLRGAFRLARPGGLDGLHIGLVDDVMTSGVTLHEAARALKSNGAARVTAITALRTP